MFYLHSQEQLEKLLLADHIYESAELLGGLVGKVPYNEIKEIQVDEKLLEKD